MQELTFSVAELLGHPGTYRDLRIDRPLAGVRTALAYLDEAEHVSAELRAESVVEGILVSGRLSGVAHLSCARCLRAFSDQVELGICELFYGPGQRPAADQDSYEVRGTDIDLEPLLRDALVLALPLHPLCAESCKGLCARCGADLNQGSCGCVESQVDPRWAPLEALRQRLQGTG